MADRRRSGRRYLRLTLAIGLAFACDGAPTASMLGPGLPGMGGRSGGASPLVGDWQAVIVTEAPGDLQTRTITWRFEAGGDCRRTIVSESLVEGFPRSTVRDCTYVPAAFDIAVTFTDIAEAVSLSYSFAGLSSDRLVLDGLEYIRTK